MRMPPKTAPQQNPIHSGRRPLILSYLPIVLTIVAITPACGRRDEAPKPVQMQSTSTFDRQRERGTQLWSEASLILYYRGDLYERWKPTGSDGKTVYASGSNAFAAVIPSTNECPRDMALVVYPGSWIICTNCKTREEVAIDLDQRLRSEGFGRVAHAISYHGM